MCTLSVILQDQIDRHPWMPGLGPTFDVPELATKADVEALRAEFRELKDLMRAAMRFDTATGQKDCQDEAKMVVLRGVAKALGVDLDEVLPKAGS